MDGLYPVVREYVVFCDADRKSDAILTLDDLRGDSRQAADFWKFILLLRDICVQARQETLKGLYVTI